jgi:hypothetical protein
VPGKCRESAGKYVESATTARLESMESVCL